MTTAVATLPATTLAGGSGNTVRFGIVLDLNGSAVPISSGDIANAKANGVEFTLQNAINLGSIAQFQKWVSDKFSVSLPAAADLPAPLDKVVGTITNMEVTIEKAHIKVPGSADKSGVKFTIEANGAFQPEISLIDGKLGIQGLVFGFSNEPAES
ncbi:hypothetical protein SAMN05444161_7158 [Rhizobiales bacterium GAS191]|jgi:hypothetical protein|nr:hypothetical protein SAMN05519104_4296 [Rhizobiales bacterium GAS188]SEE78790.1 hypothetical protein SAMN05444161_7158 [Rhizobiales bacterium GAS191]